MGDWCDCVSDDRFEPQNCLPIGARDGLRKLQASKFRRDGVWSDDAECQRHYTAHIDPNYAADHPDECDGRIKWYSKTLDASTRRAPANNGINALSSEANAKRVSSTK